MLQSEYDEAKELQFNMMMHDSFKHFKDGGSGSPYDWNFIWYAF